MRRGMVILGSLVVIGTGSGSLFAQTANRAVQSDTSGMERYVKKVIVDAKWGDGSGDFELRQTVQGPSGAGCIVLDDKGNIYVPNRCVVPKKPKSRESQKEIYSLKYFNKKGKFKGNIPLPGLSMLESYGIDKDGNIYVPIVVMAAKTSDSLGMRLVKQYSSRGEPLRTYRVSIDIGAPFGAILSGTFPEVINDELVLPSGDKEYIIGQVNKTYDKNEQRSRDRTVNCKYRTILLNNEIYIVVQRARADAKVYRMTIAENISRSRPNFYFAETPIGLDRTGDGYFEVTYETSGGSHKTEIWKFNSEGFFLRRCPWIIMTMTMVVMNQASG